VAERKKEKTDVWTVLREGIGPIGAVTAVNDPVLTIPCSRVVATNLRRRLRLRILSSA